MIRKIIFFVLMCIVNFFVIISLNKLTDFNLISYISGMVVILIGTIISNGIDNF